MESLDRRRWRSRRRQNLGAVHPLEKLYGRAKLALGVADIREDALAVHEAVSVGKQRRGLRQERLDARLERWSQKQDLLRVHVLQEAEIDRIGARRTQDVSGKRYAQQFVCDRNRIDNGIFDPLADADERQAQLLGNWRYLSRAPGMLHHRPAAILRQHHRTPCRADEYRFSGGIDGAVHIEPVETHALLRAGNLDAAMNFGADRIVFRSHQLHKIRKQKRRPLGKELNVTDNPSGGNPISLAALDNVFKLYIGVEGDGNQIDIWPDVLLRLLMDVFDIENAVNHSGMEGIGIVYLIEMIDRDTVRFEYRLLVTEIELPVAFGFPAAVDPADVAVGKTEHGVSAYNLHAPGVDHALDLNNLMRGPASDHVEQRLTCLCECGVLVVPVAEHACAVAAQAGLHYRRGRSVRQTGGIVVKFRVEDDRARMAQGGGFCRGAVGIVDVHHLDGEPLEHVVFADHRRGSCRQLKLYAAIDIVFEHGPDVFDRSMLRLSGFVVQHRKGDHAERQIEESKGPSVFPVAVSLHKKFGERNRRQRHRFAAEVADTGGIAVALIVVEAHRRIKR